MPVGLFDFAPYTSSKLTLAAGDTMVLYSDGVTEAQSVDGSEFGEARLVDVMKEQQGKPAGEVLKHVIDAVTAFTHGAEQYDDITALVIRYLGPGSAAGG